MADLSGKRTNGMPAWEFYVKKNPKWKDLVLQVEKDVKVAVLYERSTTKLKPIDSSLKAGTKLKLLSEKLTVIEKLSLATVQVGAKKGLLPIKHIRKPSKAGAVGTTGDEEKAIQSLNKLISDCQAPITIIIKSTNGKKVFEVKDIIGCRKVPGTPKADFALFNTNKKDVFWISHKAEGGPKAFQQYSGISESAGEVIYGNKQVQAFLKVVASHIHKGKLDRPIQAKGLSAKLINYSIFGPEFDSEYGIEHVNMIAQGSPILKPTKKDEVYELTWTDHWSCSGDLSYFIGDAQPVLGATFREGRGFALKDGTRYIGARVGIYPLQLMKRTGLLTVKV